METVEIYTEFDDGLSLKVTRYPAEDKMRILEILKGQPSCWNYLGEYLDNWLPGFCHLEVSEAQERLWSALFVAGFGSPITCFYSQTEDAIFLQSYIEIYKLAKEEGQLLSYYEAEDGQILGILRANDELIVWQEQAIVKLDFHLHPLWEHHHGEIISTLEMSNGQIEIWDFSGQRFTFDAKTGTTILDKPRKE